jgi:hypothetical protein
MTQDKINWARLAAWMDGEGCISIGSAIKTRIRKSGEEIKYIHYGLQVAITGTSQLLMDWLLEVFGGRVYPYENQLKKAKGKCKLCFKWHPPTGEGVMERFILALLPYLVVKRAQAELALEYLRLPHNSAKERAILKDRCKKLNRFGVSPETNTQEAYILAIKKYKAPKNKAVIESDLNSDIKCSPIVIQDASKIEEAVLR